MMDAIFPRLLSWAIVAIGMHHIFKPAHSDSDGKEYFIRNSLSSFHHLLALLASLV